jgi:hypothetical protein
MILALTFIQNSGSQASKQYDPWMDINDDGRIDMRDIGQLCINFMATGDPTKNVNVTNWPIDDQGNLRVSVMPKGNLKLLNETQKIVVIDFEKGLSTGVTAPNNQDWWNSIFYSYFIFTPKGKFNNVTSVIIQAIMSSSQYAGYNISISMGSSDATAGFVFRKDALLWFGGTVMLIFTIDNWWSQYLGPIPNSSAIQLLNAIKPGLNIVGMNAKFQDAYPYPGITIHRVEIYITYTYWDYAE